MAILPLPPTRKTSEPELDVWNRALRASPLYQNFLRKHNLVDRGQGVHMTSSQRKALKEELARAGLPLAKGMEIDAGGNLDKKSSLLKNIGIGAGIAGGIAATLFGIPGLTPGMLSGLGGSSSAIPSLAAGIPSSAAQALGPLAATAAAPTATVATGAGVGLSRLGRAWESGALPFALDYGVNLFNNWQNARAESNVLEQNLALRNRELDQQAERDAFDRKRSMDDYALNRTQYEQTEAGRAPYRSAGLGALRGIAHTVGVDMPPVETVVTPPSQMGVAAPTHRLSDYGGSTVNQRTTAPSAPVAERLVMLRAPNGMTKEVPESQVDHYVSRGATRMS